MKWSLQNFAHAKTAELSWHVLKFVAICLPGNELQQNEICIKFELWQEISVVKCPLQALRKHATTVVFWHPGNLLLWSVGKDVKLNQSMVSGLCSVKVVGLPKLIFILNLGSHSNMWFVRRSCRFEMISYQNPHVDYLFWDNKYFIFIFVR